MAEELRPLIGATTITSTVTGLYFLVREKGNGLNWVSYDDLFVNLRMSKRVKVSPESKRKGWNGLGEPGVDL